MISSGNTGHVHQDMLSVEDAYGRIMAHFSSLDTEMKPLLQGLGQVLAEDIFSPVEIPSMANSAMDGYAVRVDDLKGAAPESPRLLKVIGQVSAGEVPAKKVEQGSAIRIMTGATVPPGTDAVVPFEETDELERKVEDPGSSHIAIRWCPRQGQYIRPAGEDIKSGALVLPRDTVLRAPEVGVLASMGIQLVQVIRRPLIAILATGDELLSPGEPLRASMIYDSNSFGLAASVLHCGGLPKILGIARDTLEDVHSKLDEAESADLLLTSAGVSKGDYDLVKEVLAQRGRIGFWSVCMKPAKPLAFGVLISKGGREIPHLGLPGNPVSAMVAFEEFTRPAILKMLGRSKLERPVIQAVMDSPIQNTDGRRVFARVEVRIENGVYHAKSTGSQGSNILTSMSKANGLAICPEDVPAINVGELVKIKMLNWNEEVEV
jgi:molybdopterin molybdotransferase